MEQASDSTSPGTAVYAYCFSLPDITTPLGLGVDEHRPLQVHTLGGLSVVVSWVALDDFTGESGEFHLQDIAWLGPRACRHAAVVEQVMAQAPVFPLPFGTLFSSLAALEQEIVRRANEVSKVLEQVTDCQEWSIEGILDRNQAIAYKLSEGLESGLLTLSDNIGRRHLEEKKLRRQLASDLDSWIGEILDSVQRELAPISREVRNRRLTDNKISHWAYLVPVTKVEDFRLKIEQLSLQQKNLGLAFRLTGPWPPYTFCQTAP